MISSFFVGYIIGGNSSYAGYPYSAATAAPMMTAGNRKQRFLLGALLAILAFSSFSLGVVVNDPPSFGTGTYYGAYARKV